MGNLIVGGIVVLLIAVLVRGLIKESRKGGCAGCSGNCAGCSSCSPSPQKD